MRGIIFGLFFVFLMFPYLIFFSDIQFTQISNYEELYKAFENSFLFSFFSSGFCIFFGLLGGMSLLSVSEKKCTKLIFIFLIPTFLPHLYILASVLGLHNPFPFGFWGMVYVHTLIYGGFTSVVFYEILNNKISKYSELALVEGATRWSFTWACLSFLKKDILSIFLSLFILFFTSFSIPLVIGKNSLTIEILIYEKIKIMGQYGQALSFVFLQTLFLFFLTFFLKPSAKSQKHSEHRNVSIIAIPFLYWVYVAISALLVLTPFIQIMTTPIKWNAFLKDFNMNSQDLIMMSFSTMAISLGTGWMIYFLSSCAVFISDSKNFRKFLVSYVVPGTALIGFSLILLDISILGSGEPLVKTVFGLGFMLLPTFYRFQMVSRFESIENQLQIAHTMGAGSIPVFLQITFPQMHRSICFVSGLSAFWAASDFSVSQFLFQKSESWSLFILSIMNTYQIEKAFVFIFIPLFIGGVSYIFFQGLHYVIYPEYK